MTGGYPAWLWPYGALALVLSIVLGPFWISPLLGIGGDTSAQHYPYHVFWRDALRAGEFPFWNPYTFNGYPVFANPQAGYSYPPHWLFIWAPAEQGLNWSIGLHVLLAGLGAAWLAGRIGAGREGQFLSGLAYALGSATTARLYAGHLSFFESNAWLPLATGLALARHERLGVVRLALVIGMMVLAGQPEVLIFSLWWLPLWAAAGAVSGGQAAVIGAVVRVATAMLLGLGLAAVQFIPTLQLVSVSIRQTRIDWDFATGSSLQPWHLLTVLSPEVFGDERGSYWAGDGHEWHERLLYVGLIPLVAAFRGTGRWRWICLAFAAVAIGLAFGRYVPWYAWVREILPGYDTLRIPPKHLALAAVALAAAAGLGIHRLQGRSIGFALLAAGGALFVASRTISAWFPPLAGLLGGLDRAPNFDPSRQALTAAALILFLLGLTAFLRPPWAVRAQLFLAVLELGIVLAPYRFNPYDPVKSVLARSEHLRAYERAAYLGMTGVFVAQAGPMLQVIQPSGYAALLSNNYSQLTTGSIQPVIVGIDRAENPALPLLAVEAVFGEDDRRLTMPSAPGPPAWVARCSWPGGPLEVREPTFPRRECVTRAGARQRETPTPPGRATIEAKGLSWQSIEAEGPGWLVTTLPWYPGWAAWVDGAPAPVEVVDGALVGVALPDGTHAVTLRYRPAGLELGLVVSLATALALLGAWWWDRHTVSSARR